MKHFVFLLAMAFSFPLGAQAGEPAKVEQMVEKIPMQPDGITRLAKIEVLPEYLDEYVKFAAEVGEQSLLREPGVLAMFAMRDNDNPCLVTILEIYASQDAYKAHIASPHFQKYKQGTLKMVKSLVLSDQTPLNPANKISGRVEK